MTNSQKEDIISKEIIIALRKKGGSDTKRAIVEYFRKNSEVITEEYIDFRRISKKSNREYSPFEFFFNFSLSYLEKAEFLKKDGKVYTLTSKGREANLEFLDFSAIYKEINKVKSIHVHTKPVDITVATFDKMIAYIDENYQQKIELENLAKIGGYNVNYTSQFFKRQLGVSFLEYVLRLRLREATVRLVNSNDAVAHIASSCGFADIKAFNVAFKKHFHTTPSEYRKQANEIGRKTKLHDWKEIISTQEQDIIEILQSCLPYQDDSTNKIRLEVANQKLNDVREQLEMVVKKLQD
mgnify:CR=1 FL=1